MRVSLASPTRFHLFDLAVALQKRGVLHKLYTVYPRHRIPKALQAHAVTCPWLAPCWRFGRGGLVAATLFDRWLTLVLEPCDIFHCLSGFGVAATARAKALGATIVCDRGSTHVLHQIGVLQAESVRWGVPYAGSSDRLATRDLRQYWQADWIMVPSHQAAQTFHRYGYRPEVVPYGVNLGRWVQQPREDDTFRVLFVGALSLRKGIPRLMEALRRVKIPQWQAWLVGAPQPDTVPWLRNPPAHVKVWGSMPQDRLPWYYSQADVLVLPSVEEGLPLVLLQAMACGLPVLASMQTGVAELPILPQNLLVGDLASTLEALYKDPKLLADSRSLLADERGFLSVERYGDQMLEWYGRLHHRAPQSLAAG